MLVVCFRSLVKFFEAQKTLLDEVKQTLLRSTQSSIQQRSSLDNTEQDETQETNPDNAKQDKTHKAILDKAKQDREAQDNEAKQDSNYGKSACARFFSKFKSGIWFTKYGKKFLNGLRTSDGNNYRYYEGIERVQKMYEDKMHKGAWAELTPEDREQKIDEEREDKLIRRETSLVGIQDQFANAIFFVVCLLHAITGGVGTLILSSCVFLFARTQRPRISLRFWHFVIIYLMVYCALNVFVSFPRFMPNVGKSNSEMCTSSYEALSCTNDESLAVLTDHTKSTFCASADRYQPPVSCYPCNEPYQGFDSKAAYKDWPMLLGIYKDASGAESNFYLFVAILIIGLAGGQKDIMRHTGQNHDRHAHQLVALDYGLQKLEECRSDKVWRLLMKDGDFLRLLIDDLVNIFKFEFESTLKNMKDCLVLSSSVWEVHHAWVEDLVQKLLERKKDSERKKSLFTTLTSHLDSEQKVSELEKELEQIGNNQLKELQDREEGPDKEVVLLALLTLLQSYLHCLHCCGPACIASSDMSWGRYQSFHTSLIKKIRLSYCICMAKSLW